ncbi:MULTISPECIES: AlkA N-terminal domain-containing protein [unclassified Streptomyces]|uniref:DNA-3-methyladenine glycosylase family protein n=1 Tax=unclassified Streptomyces TaxID=2593676 RepID=UPI0033E5AEA7
MTLLRLFPQGPTDPETALRMLAAHAIPGAEEADIPSRTYTRLLPHAGASVRVKVTFTEDQVAVDLPHGIPDPDGLAVPIRRWLDLDSDTTRIADALAADPLIRPLVEHRPGIRLIGYPDEFEAVTATVVGQQVSLAAARTFMGRLVATYGKPAAGLKALPAPQDLAVIPDAELQAAIGLTGARTRALRAVAQKWADGFTLAHLTADEARRALLALPGIGPWTADYLTVRALQHPDTFAPGDLVARRALGSVTADQARITAERWAPWRSYALMHLWADAAYAAPGRGRRRA